MSCIGISRNRRAVWNVNTDLPSDITGVYQLGFPLQISPTEVGIALNIRWSGIKTIDLELGNDFLIMDHLGGIDPTRIQTLNRSETKPHPISGRSTFFVRYPVIGGFVPYGALDKGGALHPHAGTGFGVGQVRGFPADQVVANEAEYEDADQYHFKALEIMQYSYNDGQFSVCNTRVFAGNNLLDGWYLEHPGLTTAIADGEDLLQPFCAGCNGQAGCGVLRWHHGDQGWYPAQFIPITFSVDNVEAHRDASTKNVPNELLSLYTEPSLVRDIDGHLLFTARAQGTQPYATGPLEAEHVHIWRSTDGGSSWTKIIKVPHLRALTPMSLNRAVDGTIYVAANPARTTNSLGEKLGSIVMRETLMIWPLSDDRRHLEDPITIRDCPREFAPPPHGSFWRVDHPIGLTVRLVDNQWHHILIFRGLEHNECDSDAPVTPFTGTYIEEVHSNSTPRPPWEFLLPSKLPLN